MEKRIGVCNLCEAICGLELTIENGAVTSIRGNPDDPLSRGYICPKGVSLADVHADPDRLRQPGFGGMAEAGRPCVGLALAPKQPSVISIAQTSR